eukprot:649429-Pelagomonas_calceolata.AAC.1
MLTHTRLEIRGVGFSSDRLQGGNQVFVGPFECSVIDHYTSDTVVGAAFSHHPGSSALLSSKELPKMSSHFLDACLAGG